VAQEEEDRGMCVWWWCASPSYPRGCRQHVRENGKLAKEKKNTTLSGGATRRTCPNILPLCPVPPKPSQKTCDVSCMEVPIGDALRESPTVRHRFVCVHADKFRGKLQPSGETQTD
jgi:hypothetical protein